MLSNPPHPNFLLHVLLRPTLLLTSQRLSPEAIAVAAVGLAFGVKIVFTRGEDSSLNRVNLVDEIPVSGRIVYLRCRRIFKSGAHRDLLEKG